MSHNSPSLSALSASLALAFVTGGLHGMETTGSAAVSAGSMDSESGLNFDGAYAILLGGGFGFQVDGMHSSIGSTEFIGGGAQVFWQNNSPWLASLGYAGVHGEWLDSHEISSGLEFQQAGYSIGAKVGYAQIGYDHRAPFIDDEHNSLLMEIHADFYASDSLRASLGVEYCFDLFFTKAELEWLTPLDGLSLFANCMVGENDYDHALVGLRYYFGGDRTSLKGRRQTPRPMTSNLLHAVGNYGAYYNSRARKFLAEYQGFIQGSGSVNYGTVNTFAGGGGTTGATTWLGNGTLTLAGGRSIGGSGVIAGETLTINGSGPLGPGSSSGLLSFGGSSLTLNNSSLAGSGVIGGGTLTLSTGTLLLGPGPSTGTLLSGSGSGGTWNFESVAPAP